MRFKKLASPIFFLLAGSASLAEDWPTFRHDNARSGTTAESPTFPLKPSWSRLSPSPPKTAWARPAKWDAYAGNEGLQAMRDFDTAFYVTISGDHAYFASSLDDAIHCLDAKTGTEKWVAFANAPVRLPPTITGGKAYFGSDDGFAYCVDTKVGALLWKTRAAPSDRLIPSDGRMISPWPVRTGIMVKENTAYFGASLLPWNESIFLGVDAKSGKPEGEGRFRTSVSNVTFQGMLLATSDQLLVPQGRAQVLKFKSDGTSAGAMAAAGGVFVSAATVADESFLISGPKNQKSREDVLFTSSLKDGAAAFSLSTSNRAVAADGVLYTHVAGKLTALDLKTRADQERRVHFLKRKAARGITPEEKAELDSLPTEIAKTVRWQVELPPATDLIIAGEFLFTATADAVTAHRRDTGEPVWQSKVKGTPLGLAFAGNRLYVSTDQGHILTFSP